MIELADHERKPPWGVVGAYILSLDDMYLFVEWRAHDAASSGELGCVLCVRVDCGGVRDL